MAIKFLSGLNLSDVTAGSLLKLDSNGNIVAAVDGVDYISSSVSSPWTNTLNGIYYDDSVRIGTYQSFNSPSAKLHVFEYGSTNVKLLVEDGATGDATMQFKTSTRQYTMGIDNSDSEKFVIAASSALGTTNVLEIATTGAAAFQTNVLFNQDIYVDKILGKTYSSNSFLDLEYDQTAWVNSVALASVGSNFYLADTNANIGATQPAHQFFTGTGDIDTATALMTIYTSGSIQFNQFGAGFVKTTANGTLTLDTNSYALSTHTHSQYLRSDADDTATGTVTFSGTVNLNAAVNFNGVNGQNFTVNTDSQRIIWDYQRNGTRRMSFYHETNQDTFNFSFQSGANLQINGNRILTTNDSSSFATASHTHTLSDITDAGTAAAADTTDFATAAQGALADTALQSLPTHYHDGRYYTKTESDNNYAKAGDNFIPINADGQFEQSTEGVVLGSASEYRGLAFPNGGRNFVFEVSIKGNSLANHQGIFWGLDALETIYGNGEAGYKLTHQGERQFHIRDIATNTNQATSQDVLYAPNDGLHHRYKLINYTDTTSGRTVFKVYVDGNLIFDDNSGAFNTPPQQPTYFGFINYTGDVTFSNWNIREITGEDAIAVTIGENVFQPIGNYLTSLPAHHHDARYYTETEMDEFFDGTTAKTGYNKTNWDDAYTTTQSLGSAAFTSANDYAAASHNHDTEYLGITAKAADSDLLDGLNPSTGATANTIVRRDANGDTSLRILNITNELRVPSGGGVTDPSITCTTDGDTGLNFDGAGDMSFTSNGTKQFDFSDLYHSGNLTIGTLDGYTQSEVDNLVDAVDLAKVISVDSHFGTANQGYVTSGGTYGTELRKIKRITLTSGGSNWDGDNHCISSTNTAGAFTDSISINSYNDITLRLDSNNNNAGSYLRVYHDTLTSGDLPFWTGSDGTYLKSRLYGNVGINAEPTTDSYKLNMGGNIDMNNYQIDYVGQLHFQDNVRFYDDGNDSYLNFKFGDSSSGGIKFLDGQGTHYGRVYGDSDGANFGLLNRDGQWGVRTTATSTYLYYDGATKLETTASGVSVSGDAVVTGNLQVGVDGSTPQIKMIYDDNHTSGDGWDTVVELGRLEDRQSAGNTFPTYLNINGYGLSFQANSDGVVFGMEEYSAGNYRPVIAWGDDATDTPMQFRYRNTSVFSVGYQGNITAAGVVTASGGNSTDWNLAYGWGNHADFNYLTAVPANISVTSITVGGVKVEEATDRPGLLEINRDGTDSWAGIMTKFSGTAEWALMGDENEFGLYDDQYNQWAWRYVENDRFEANYAGATKFQTQSGGAKVIGDLEVTEDLLVKGAASGILVDSAGHASLRVDRGGTGYDANLLFYTAGVLNWRMWMDGDDDYLYIRDEVSQKNMLTFRRGAGIQAGNAFWANVNSDSVFNNYNENLRLPPAGNDVSVIAFRASGEGGVPSSSVLGYSDRHETRIGSTWKQRIYSSSVQYNTQVLVTGDITTSAELNLPNSHSSSKIQLHGNDGDAHCIGTSSFNNTYGPVNWTNGTLGHVFFGATNSPIAILGNGGSTAGDHTSTFFGSVIPNQDRLWNLGGDVNRWRIVFCEILDSAGQHEKNLQNPEGEKSVGEYETGTVLVWKGGKNVPCTTAADHMRMGIAVKGIDSPLIQGAEPVLVTGAVKEGDYLVTSGKKEGHAEAISPAYMRQHNLFDCVLGKALESAEGESHLVKTWINI